jgi:hypothetical protein
MPTTRGGGAGSNGRFRARDVLRDTASIYRSHFVRVAGSAVLVFGVTGWLDAVIETAIDSDNLTGTGWDALLSVAAAIVGTVGFVFYCGLLDKVLEDHHEGRPDRPIVEVARELPIWRLFCADLALTFATLIGFLLLVLPGFAVFTLFALVGPVIVAEDRKVFDSLRRSAVLVLHRFWLVLVLVTIPVLFEEQIVHAVDYREFDHPLVAAFITGGVVAGAVISVVGLIEVVVARRLMEQHPPSKLEKPATLPDVATPRSTR